MLSAPYRPPAANVNNSAGARARAAAACACEPPSAAATHAIIAVWMGDGIATPSVACTILYIGKLHHKRHIRYVASTAMKWPWRLASSAGGGRARRTSLALCVCAVCVRGDSRARVARSGSVMMSRVLLESHELVGIEPYPVLLAQFC